VRPIEHIWAFTGEWYEHHADTDWTKWSLREAAEMLRRHGLTESVWSLRDEVERF
jgi:hypothetical protein